MSRSRSSDNLGLWTYVGGLLGKRRGANLKTETHAQRRLEEEVAPTKETPKAPEKISLKAAKMAVGKAKSKAKKR